MDALLGCVPGIGGAAASRLVCYRLYEAHRLQFPSDVCARMAAKVAIEGVVGAIPLLGDVFDVGFRANRRNDAILQAHFERAGLV